MPSSSSRSFAILLSFTPHVSNPYSFSQHDRYKRRRESHHAAHSVSTLIAGQNSCIATWPQPYSGIVPYRAHSAHSDCPRPSVLVSFWPFDWPFISPGAMVPQLTFHLLRALRTWVSSRVLAPSNDITAAYPEECMGSCHACVTQETSSGPSWRSVSALRCRTGHVMMLPKVDRDARPSVNK